MVIRKSLTVFFSIVQHGQDEDGAIILAGGYDRPIALASFFVGYFVNADGAHILDLGPVDFTGHLPLQRTEDSIIANFFFETNISHRAADELLHQVLVIGLGMRTALLIPAQFLRGRRIVQASWTLRPTRPTTSPAPTLKSRSLTTRRSP